VFSLPKGWGDKPDEPYDYEVWFWNLVLNLGKVTPWQLSPEEIALAESLKGKKAPPPKKGEEIPPSAEEIALKEKV